MQEAIESLLKPTDEVSVAIVRSDEKEVYYEEAVERH